MRLPGYERRPGGASAWAGLREVVAFIRSDRRVSTGVVLMGPFSIFGFPYLVLMPVFARDVLHRGAAGYGGMMTSVGSGALVGALGVALHAGPRDRGLGGAGAASHVESRYVMRRYVLRTP